MENITKSVIGQRINSALNISGKKQKELAAVLGVPDNTISYFVSGKRTPNTEQIIKIAQYLKVSADFLLGLTNASAIVSEDNKIIRDVCDFTGLEESTVDYLHNQKLIADKLLTNKIYFIDFLIKNSYEINEATNKYIEFVSNATKSIKSNKEEIEKIPSSEIDTQKNNNDILLHIFTISDLTLNEYRDMVDFYYFKIIEEFKKIISSYTEIENSDFKIIADSVNTKNTKFFETLLLNEAKKD